ncbi:MAG: hypothetical protein GPOALKHO_000560 [Sodalis sp.]|uniref:hypothetical protein n=1 Tax=Sodalis sp. (in: enterobacteria) TaxID=1898979 RepID=UPI003872F4F8|nr:MAG: hypothetical protein GPOALKHO_000560 [Sodalis sp.]
MRNMPLPDALNYQFLLRESLIAVVHQDHQLASVAGESIAVRQLENEPFIF